MLGHYLTVAFRNFRRNKFHTSINVIGLAIGLSCFVGAYVMVHYVSSFDKGFANSERIYTLSQQTWVSGVQFGSGAMPLTADPTSKYLKADFPELEAAAYMTYGQETAIKTEDDKAFGQVQYAEAALLDIFQMPFVAKSAENPLALPRSAIVRQDAAERLFGTADPIGQTFLIGNMFDVTITGVIGDLPQPSHLTQAMTGAPFDLIVSIDVWDAIQARFLSSPSDNVEAPRPEQWTSISSFTYVLLPADGSLTPDAFNDRLADFGDRHMPPDQGEAKFSAQHISKLLLDMTNSFVLQGAMGISITGMLLFLGGLVLATAGLNYANLAIAQATSRAKEVGMRKVLGAKRRQVLTQYLFEAFILVTAALVISLTLVQGAVLAIGSGSLPWTDGASFWLFLLGVVVVVGVLAGGYPALILSRVRPIQALRAGGMKGGSRHFRMFLVGVQFTVASFLLIAVMVITSHNNALQESGMSIDGDPQVIIGNNIAQSEIDVDTFRSAMLRNPSIKSVTFSQRPPWDIGTSIVILSDSPDPAAAPSRSQRFSVSYDYFSTLDMPILAGRTFSHERSADASSGLNSENVGRSEPVKIVIDRFTAEEMGYANPQDAVGKILYEQVSAGNGIDAYISETQIIGVVENKPMKLVSLGLKTNIYFLTPAWAGIPIIKISGDDIAGALAHIDTVWDEMAPNLPLKLSFMDEKFEQAYAMFGGISSMVTAMAMFAFIVASLGLFGMAALITRRRAQEIGIRKTMGASVSQILRLLVWDFSKPVMIANLIAWPLAFVVMMGYLNLFTVQIPISPLPFIGSLIITLVIAWIAVGGQAWRAARTNPAHVLKYE